VGFGQRWRWRWPLPMGRCGMTSTSTCAGITGMTQEG